jgi:dipeptidyl-peptidase-3
VDQAIHKEVLARYAKLGIKPYRGFIQPRLTPVMKDNKIVDVKVAYPTSFYQQMIEFGKNYSYLPIKN